jgi:hypothetical protein
MPALPVEPRAVPRACTSAYLYVGLPVRRPTCTSARLRVVLVGVVLVGDQARKRGGGVVLAQRAADRHDLVDLLPRERHAAGKLW